MTSIILSPEDKIVTALFVFEKNSLAFVQLGLGCTSPLFISLGHEHLHQLKSRNYNQVPQQIVSQKQLLRPKCFFLTESSLPINISIQFYAELDLFIDLIKF